MKKITQPNTTKKALDLRKWWLQIEKKDVENIINSKDKWCYWWFSEDKKFVTTIKNWKITNYKVWEVEILSSGKPKTNIILRIKQKNKSELLTDLFLSPENRVGCSADAYEKAKSSDKTKFWFISKWKNKAVIVLDFSKWKKPKITSYPLDKYNIKMKAVEV